MPLGWSFRHWAVALAGTVLSAVVIAVPTGIIRTPLYHRMTPVSWWDYPELAMTAVLEGVLLASYARTGRAGQAGTAQTAGCWHSSPSAARCATSWSCSRPG